jgi:hypothetical protein
MAFNYSPRVITNGLVLYLDAGNQTSYVGNGTAWRDLTPNGNNGTLTNSPTFTRQSSGAIVFNGSSNYVITPTNLSSLNLNSSITIDTWFKPTALANASHADGIVSKGLFTDNNSAIYELLIRVTGGINYPFVRISTSAGVQSYAPTQIPTNPNQIYNIVCTYNGSTIRIFVNNVEAGTGAAASGTLVSNTQELAIGTRYLNRGGGNDSFFTGNIYSVKIYNRALSATEIQQNYDAFKGRFIL